MKRWLIKDFLRRYPVNLSEAVCADPEGYDSFNHFFTRALRPGVRPPDPNPLSIVSPADGQWLDGGALPFGRLIEAKGHAFQVEALLGGDPTDTAAFEGGAFFTVYLAPPDYHRVHVPFEGRLKKTVHIPGALYSVHPRIVAAIPHVLSKNERLVCFFETDRGRFAVVLVGAMIVGRIGTVWKGILPHRKQPAVDSFDSPLSFKKGDEMGHFELGSTVIVLLDRQMAHGLQWVVEKPESHVKVGEAIAYVDRMV